MRYGYFDDDAREYVIRQPDTPLPWINYLGQEDYFAMLSNTGGGYSFYRDARLRRLIRYRYNNTPADVGGRALYLRLADGDYWSPTWQPVRRPLDAYECRHGLGYTRIASRHRDIAAEVTYLVPLGQTLEAWRVRLTNHSTAPVELQVFAAVEFCLWDAWDDQTNYQRNFNIGEVEVDEAAGVIYHKTEYRERRDHFAYWACSAPVAGFDTQREAFLGPYRGWHEPAAVIEGRCRNSIAHGWSPIGAHQVALTLPPGESREGVFLLGYAENPRGEKFTASGALNTARVRPVIARYTDPAVLDEALAELHTYWDRRLDVYRVQTPDEHTDRMVNTWNPYQVMATFNLSRSASLYESGVGRGMGFRDSNQDLLGFVQLDPPRARQRLLDLAATQLPDGGAYHQYQPLTKRGNHAVGSGFNDDPLWLVLAAAAYLKETGDDSVLDESVPYDNGPGTEASLYEHLTRALQYTLARLGPHGLPQIGHADWNDCLNLNCFSAEPGESFQTHSDHGDTTIAESVFIAGLFVLAAREMADIMRHIGRTAEAETYERHAQDMAQVALEHGWDGEWFLRAYDRRGDKVGSHECEEGRIFVEPQGICVMAGIGLESGHARRALDAVESHLATPHGIVLHQPAYTRYYLNLGEISSYPPGYKENAGVFCHTNPWIAIAEAIVGRGDRAHDVYTRINPSVREAHSEVHRCEPYVYAQMIAGRDAPTHGEAKNSWLTGTAAWNYVAITQWILGIRPTFDGLRIAPVIPADWPGFQATRVFRGVTYHITVERAGEGNRVLLTVDGQPVEGDVVPLPPGGQATVTVEAILQ
ncbi:MAG: glycosyl transferase [Chloroflexi bacterium]|nr:glycosyl transferase [Chloroflexota bacterium]MBU1746403.1 glycosyl transferase [Chloroflexota bacterium]